MDAYKWKNYRRISSAARRATNILAGEKMGQLFSTAAKTLGSKVVSMVHITHFVAVVKQQEQRLYMECEFL